MADTNNHTVPEEEHHNALNEFKRSLEGWREVLLPINGLLNWDKAYHPAIIVGLNTFIFMLIWYFEPSVLTTFSLLGLTISLIDFLVPMIGPNLMSTKWTGRQEQQYEDICIRMLNAKIHFYNITETMVTLKTDRPKTYFLIVMGTLIGMAYVGSKLDNLFLTYFLVTLIMLIPGIRRHGILQKYFQRAFGVIRSLVMGKGKKFKSN